MVEQIDRDAAARVYQNQRDHDMASWVTHGKADADWIVKAYATHRLAERARIIARMREPDAKMVEIAKAITPAVLKYIPDYDEVPPEHVWSRPRYEWLTFAMVQIATAALSAAADAMERIAAMDELIAMSAEELETNNGS